MASESKTSLSIHPRNWKGTSNREKRNTSGTRKKPGRIERVIAAIEAHVERHPNDAMSQSRLGKLRTEQ
jgi:hypothetical protein